SDTPPYRSGYQSLRQSCVRPSVWTYAHFLTRRLISLTTWRRQHTLRALLFASALTSPVPQRPPPPPRAPPPGPPPRPPPPGPASQGAPSRTTPRAMPSGQRPPIKRVTCGHSDEPGLHPRGEQS